MKISQLFEISKAEKKRQKSASNQQKFDAEQQQRDQIAQAEKERKSAKLAQIDQMRRDAQAQNQQFQQQQKVDQPLQQQQQQMLQQKQKSDQQLQQQKKAINSLNRMPGVSYRNGEVGGWPFSIFVVEGLDETSNFYNALQTNGLIPDDESFTFPNADGYQDVSDYYGIFQTDGKISKIVSIIDAFIFDGRKGPSIETREVFGNLSYPIKVYLEELIIKKLEKEMEEQLDSRMYDLLDDMRDGSLSQDDFDDAWLSVQNYVADDDELLKALLYVSEGTWNYSVMVANESPGFKQRFFQELARRRDISDLVYVLTNNNTTETADDLAYAFAAIKGMGKNYLSRAIKELAEEGKWKTIDAISKLQLTADTKKIIGQALSQAEQTYSGPNPDRLERAINKFITRSNKTVTKKKSGFDELDTNLYLFVYDEDVLTELEQQGYSGISNVYFSHGLGVINTETKDYLLAYADYSDDGILKYHTNLDNEEDIFNNTGIGMGVFADMDDIATLRLESEEGDDEDEIRDILDEINDLVQSLKKQYPDIKLHSAEDIA